MGRTERSQGRIAPTFGRKRRIDCEATQKGDEVDETGEAVDPYAPVARLAVARLPDARRRGEAGAGARRLPERRVRPLRRAEVPLHRAGREPGLVRGGDPRRSERLLRGRRLRRDLED